MQRVVKDKFRSVVLALAWLLSVTAAAGAQQDRGREETRDGASTPGAKSVTPAEARHAQLVADAQRLFRLSGELKAAAQGSKDVLPLDLVKKAAAVEALAHSLKERLKTGPD